MLALLTARRLAGPESTPLAVFRWQVVEEFPLYLRHNAAGSLTLTATGLGQPESSRAIGRTGRAEIGVELDDRV